MTSEKITHITCLLQEVKEVNDYLHRLQEMAKRIVEGCTTVELNLTGFETKTEKVTINEEGDMVKPGTGGSFFLVHFFKAHRLSPMSDTSEATHNVLRINHTITDTAALKILAILLDEKKKRKTQLHKELERLGVKIGEIL